MHRDIKNGRFYFGDCLEVMKEIPDSSVDMILCDLPYGTTACKWDTIIPFEPLWEQYHRIAKLNGVIVLTASQPFTTALIMSNINNFRYNWVYLKSRPTGFANSKLQPLRCLEDVCIFYKKPPTYNPQNLIKIDRRFKNSKSQSGSTLRGSIVDSKNKGSLRTPGKIYKQEYTNYPTQLIKFGSVVKTIHPTQKPVALFEYLIKTYTNENELVLDNCAGSGTTAIACENTNRRWICIEKEREYAIKACDRIKKHQKQGFI